MVLICVARFDKYGIIWQVQSKNMIDEISEFKVKLIFEGIGFIVQEPL